MRILTILSATAVIGLSACIDEYQTCVRNSSKDLRVVNDLISHSQTVVSRGYDFETLISTEVQEVICITELGDTATCLVEVGTTYQSPVAVDLEAERRKLAQLLEQRKLLETRLAQATEACRAAYPPEG